MTILNFEQFFLETMSSLGDTNFDVIIKGLIVIFFIFWLVVVSWVWTDISERTKKTILGILFRVFATLLVLLIPILGLIIYFIIRPSSTIEETKWADLERRYLIFETSELGDCPSCKFQLQPGFVCCPVCGYQIKQKCIDCKEYYNINWKVCPFCGMNKPEKLYEIETKIHPTISVKNVVVDEIKESLQPEDITQTTVVEPVTEQNNTKVEIDNVDSPKVETIERTTNEIDTPLVKEMVSETVIDTAIENKKQKDKKNLKLIISSAFTGLVTNTKNIYNSLVVNIDKLLPKKKRVDSNVSEKIEQDIDNVEQSEKVTEQNIKQKHKKKHKKNKK